MQTPCKRKREAPGKEPLFEKRMGYFFGAAACGAVVAGRGCVAAGAEGTGAATPDEALYASTTALVTSVVGEAHITLLC